MPHDVFCALATHVHSRLPTKSNNTRTACRCANAHMLQHAATGLWLKHVTIQHKPTEFDLKHVKNAHVHVVWKLWPHHILANSIVSQLSLQDTTHAVQETTTSWEIILHMFKLTIREMNLHSPTLMTDDNWRYLFTVQDMFCHVQHIMDTRVGIIWWLWLSIRWWLFMKHISAGSNPREMWVADT